MPDQPPVHDLGELEQLSGEWTPRRLLHLAQATEMQRVAAALNALPELIAVVKAGRELGSALPSKAPFNSPAGRFRAALRPFYGSEDK